LIRAAHGPRFSEHTKWKSMVKEPDQQLEYLPGENSGWFVTQLRSNTDFVQMW